MSARANSLRGESALSIGGREFVLRPSFENLVAAEEELGSLFALVERGSQGELTLGQIAGLLWHCIDAEPRPSREETGEAVLALGLVKATVPVRAVLTQVVQGRA